ncbi:response regulator transcription factor [Piscinibacter sp.]|uniref:response regulator transcription factor n=1 Tax=Piscinibacter sp. TaxID=1903157 RepID=UPI002B7CCB44|nr:response regulator transcription factor [Albitalea sp.]HUG22438.1 response regulator transcription factor [Albitalea sp.]
MSSVVLYHSDLELAHRLAENIISGSGLRVTGIAHHLPSLREALAHGLPDLLLIDLMLPSNHVRGLLNELRGSGHMGRPQVVMLAMSSDDPRLMEALCYGADAYFVHTRPSTSLAAALQQVLRGESAMSPQIARQVKSHFDAMSWDETDFVGESQNPLRLNESDERLLRWTAEGYLVNEVARGLQLSPQSVGVRIRNIYRKLQFDVRAASLSLMAA